MSIYDDILQTLAADEHWPRHKEEAILEPFRFITSNPGKEIRGKLIEAFNQWLNVPADKLHVISKVVNMLHSASLMVDDIEDDSQLRRGQPVTHKIYGVAQTINTANYVYFLAYQELFALKGTAPAGPSQAALHEIVTEELLSLHRGQGLEILWRDSLQCPSEEDYVSMVNQKTGGLLRIGIKLMMACATTSLDVDYIPLVNAIGVFFQIRDDLMNLQSKEYTSNKGFAEDLSEGKFSFPVVHGIHADRSNRQILNVLQKRPTTPTLKVHTIRYLEHHTKSFEYTLSVLDKLEAQTRAEIVRLGGNRKLEAIIDLLHVKPEGESPQSSRDGKERSRRSVTLSGGEFGRVASPMSISSSPEGTPTISSTSPPAPSFTSADAAGTPPPWMSVALRDLASRYPQDKFEAVLKRVHLGSPPEWRLRCIDCPGKVYIPGPSETLYNFEIHLKNANHRQTVNVRVRGTPGSPPSSHISFGSGF